jgi:hypothetical protein
MRGTVGQNSQQQQSGRRHRDGTQLQQQFKTGRYILNETNFSIPVPKP